MTTLWNLFEASSSAFKDNVALSFCSTRMKDVDDCPKKELIYFKESTSFASKCYEMREMRYFQLYSEVVQIGERLQAEDVGDENVLLYSIFSIQLIPLILAFVSDLFCHRFDFFLKAAQNEILFYSNSS